MLPSCRPLLCCSSAVQGVLINPVRHRLAPRDPKPPIEPNKPKLEPREDMEKRLMFFYEIPPQLRPPVVEDPKSLVDRGAQTLMSDRDVRALRDSLQWSVAASMETRKDLPEFWEYHEPRIEDPTLFPTYDKLNISLVGYDYPIVQKYQSYVHRLCEKLNINVNDTYPMPSRSWRTQVFKRGSVAVQAEFTLHKYERIVQITDVSSVILPQLIDLIHTNQPESIEVNVKEFDQEEDDNRYIPNTELRMLKEELKSFEDKAVRKKLGFIVDLQPVTSTM